ncbi:hypothetical protein QE152_g25631 [Popillia japonica]|uniref:Uncharacterized protein n=1 Tax=Popillia japonica TaxID=7064 RepID=A0AAW1JZX2_POPJA
MLGKQISLYSHPKQKTIEPQYDLSINNTDLQHPESIKFLGLIEPQYDLSINNTDLQHPESIKFLGLDIDENLSWAEACTNIASKLNRSCYLFRSLRDLLDFDTLHKSE